mmetsp:Transcript_99408/g.284343  ORF Transcript_99408/g.284343 Transcript_99408/m.284343 type:complete len:204 (-) Transcript_99408:209-820(-)
MIPTSSRASLFYPTRSHKVPRLAEPLHLVAVAYEVGRLRSGQGLQSSFIVATVVSFAVWVAAQMVEKAWTPDALAAATAAASLDGAIEGLAALGQNRAVAWAALKVGLGLISAERLYATGHNWAFLVAVILGVGLTGVLPASVGPCEVWAQANSDPILRFTSNVELVCLAFIAFAGGAAGVVALAGGANAFMHLHGLAPKPPV